MNACLKDIFTNEKYIGRIRRVVAATLVHTLYTLRFCAKQNLGEKTCCFTLSSRYFCASHSASIFFSFVVVSDGFHLLTGLSFTSAIFNKIPMIAKERLFELFCQQSKLLSTPSSALLCLASLHWSALVKAEPYENSLCLFYYNLCSNT